MINHKELNVKSVYKDKRFFSETNIIEDLIFWKERLNIAGKKNNAIFTRPINNPNSFTQNLTGDQFSITSNSLLIPTWGAANPIPLAAYML